MGPHADGSDAAPLLQAYYLIAPFPIERFETTRVRNERHAGGTVVSRLVDYPVRSLVFAAGNNLQELATEVGNACVRLQVHHTPSSGRMGVEHHPCSFAPPPEHKRDRSDTQQALD